MTSSIYRQHLYSCSADSQNKGVLVVLNNEVNAASEVTKTHTMSLDTFKSPTFGPLGIVDNNKVIYYRKKTPTQHILSDTIVNDVALIKTCAGMDDGYIHYCLSKGVKGIVLEAWDVVIFLRRCLVV